MIEKSFEAKTDNLHLLLDLLESELEKHGCNMKISTSLLIAIEEIFVNVSKYAYPSSTGDLTVKFDFVDDDVIFTFIDSGIPFDPVAKQDPDITLSAEDRPIGGLGIYMVKQTMDEMKYERKDNKNILYMKKRYKN